MFVVTEADAAAILAEFEQRGELSAAIELRRRFPGITDNRQARECVRTIAGWQPERDQPRRGIATIATCQKRHVVNLLLVLMVVAIWFLMNHHGLFTLPP